MQSARMIWAQDEAGDLSAKGGRDMRSGGVTGLHPTQAGHLYISANTPHFWAALCAKVGLPALAQDPRYDSVKKRAANALTLCTQLRQALQAKTALEWEAHFGQEVPCAAARRIEDMFNDPQVLAQGLVTTVAHPTLGSYRGFAHPIAFARTPGPAPFAAPSLGQHSVALKVKLNAKLNVPDA
jgi:formyl-CoA transferase